MLKVMRVNLPHGRGRFGEAGPDFFAQQGVALVSRAGLHARRICPESGGTTSSRLRRASAKPLDK